MPTVIDRMRTDMEQCVNFFSKTKSAKRVNSSFEIIGKVIALLESNPRMLYLDFYSLWRAYPDVPLDYIEKLLTKRDDLDKTQLKDLMDTVKTRMKEERVEQFQPTLFSKISLK